MENPALVNGVELLAAVRACLSSVGVVAALASVVAIFAVSAFSKSNIIDYPQQHPNYLSLWCQHVIHLY